MGGALEPRKQRLQRAEIAPLHSSPGDSVRLCLKKKRNKVKGRKKTFEKEGVVGIVMFQMWVKPNPLGFEVRSLL